jgi:hypothetical protein
VNDNRFYLPLFPDEERAAEVRRAYLCGAE